MAIGSTINWSPQIKELNIFSMPFLMPDYKAIDALTRGDVARNSGKSAKQGYVPLPGVRTVSGNFQLQKGGSQADDLKGLKIRVVGLLCFWTLLPPSVPTLLK